MSGRFQTGTCLFCHTYLSGRILKCTFHLRFPNCNCRALLLKKSKSLSDKFETVQSPLDSVRPSSVPFFLTWSPMLINIMFEPHPTREKERREKQRQQLLFIILFHQQSSVFMAGVVTCLRRHYVCIL